MGTNSGHFYWGLTNGKNVLDRDRVRTEIGPKPVSISPDAVIGERSVKRPGYREGRGLGIMIEQTVEGLSLGLILYVLLPMWVVAGSLDYWCHRVTRIEENTGLSESVLHALMGALVGIPLWLGIFFEINVLVLLVCFIFFVVHEVVAHFDVVLAQPVRRISVWEQHVHSYLSTLPFYVLTLIICRNWSMFLRTITFQWADGLTLTPRLEPVGTMGYVWWYATLMLVIAIVPYTEELIRCWRVRRARAAR